MDGISVIIPTYNRSQKLKKSIASVQQQTYRELEIIVVDDGSEDDTPEVVRSMQDGRIRYVRLERNQGAAAARNEGVRRAIHSLIAFQDSDDLWRPAKLERQMSYWMKNLDYSMVYCDYVCHNGTEGDVDNQKKADENKETFEGKIFLPLLIRNTIGTPTMLMRKECFLRVGGFDPALRSLEDWDFAIRFSEKYTIGYINEVLVDVHISEGGISSGIGDYYDSRCRMIAKYEDQLTANGLFELALGDLFWKAERRGVLETVKKMMLLYIENG